MQSLKDKEYRYWKTVPMSCSVLKSENGQKTTRVSIKIPEKASGGDTLKFNIILPKNMKVGSSIILDLNIPTISQPDIFSSNIESNMKQIINKGYVLSCTNCRKKTVDSN